MTPEAIQKAVADYYQMTPAQLLWFKWSAAYVIPRQLAMKLARDLTGLSYPAIARAFMRKDHTTIMYGVTKIARLMETDIDLNERYQYLKKKLEKADGIR